MNIFTSLRCAVLVLTAIILGTSAGIAGGLISFDSRGTSARQADSLSLVTTIREQVAVTKTTQVFRNTTSSRIAPIFGFVLPTSAMVTGLRWEINGQWYKASMKSEDTTAPGNGGGNSAGGDARLKNFATAFDSAPFIFPFKDSIAPGQSIRVELTYVELLTYRNGAVSYRFSPCTLRAGALPNVDLWMIDIESGSDISNVVTTPGNLTTTQPTAKKATMKGQNLVASTFAVSFMPRYDALTMNVLSTKPEGQDGYALMLAVPKTESGNAAVLPKRVTFVIDHSGSMGTTRMKCAREAAKGCVQNLNSDDIFNVLQFDDAVSSWSSSYQRATPQNIASATYYIDGIRSAGGTDIMKALSTALGRHVSDNYVNVIIFLSDGESSIDFDALRKLNTSATRVFVFGIGQGVDEGALTRIGAENNGATFLVQDESRVFAAVTALFDFIKDPVVKNPKISFSPTVMYDVYPSVIPDIYQDQQLVMVGRYTTPGDVTVTVSGTDKNGTVSLPFAARLTDDPNINIFVAKIWAKYRIDMLIEWMRKENPTSSRWKEWRDEIVRLGKTYDIVTDYTSLIDDGTQDGGGTASVTHDEINIALNYCTISPNPVRENTSIRIDLSQFSRARVRIEIVDLQGKVMSVLYADENAPEILDLQWDGTDMTGARVASGGYQLVINVDGLQSSKAINVVR